MNTPPLRALLLTALAGSAIAAGAAASPASAMQQTKTCPSASASCSSDGSYVWRSVKTTKKTSGNAQQLCARAFSSGGAPLIASPCANNIIMIIRCYFGADAGFGVFSGSSSFVIEGRVGNDNDQQGC